VVIRAVGLGRILIKNGLRCIISAIADEFELNYGNKPLGKDLIRLYTQAVARKSRLLDTRKYNYYFTEKEYERVKLEDDKKTNG